MKGLFIPEITAEMFRNGCLESIEALMAEGEIYDIDYQQPCKDVISRQAAIDESFEVDTKEYGRIEVVGVDAINSLPPVNPQPNKEDIHREREQAYMLGYEDGSRKYRTAQSEDAISRQVVLDIVDSYSESQSNVEDVTQDIISDIVALLPVNPLAKDYNTIYYTPQPKTGHWIEQIDYEENCRTLICSNCDRPALHDEDSIWKHKFCPHCGAKMQDLQEESEEMQDVVKRKASTPREDYEPLYNCENWIP